MTVTRVAAFGDSLMGGQGLNENQKFKFVLADALRVIRRTNTAEIVWDASRSGAQIHRHGRQRSDFLDTYPSLFTSERALNDFIAGTNDSPASALHGEIPAPFPTVLGQVRLLPRAVGATGDVSLFDGGYG